MHLVHHTRARNNMLLNRCAGRASCKKTLQTKGFAAHLDIARDARVHALQRKCLTGSDGSCLIIRYFFITWESVALLTTKFSVNCSWEEFTEQERWACRQRKAAPARKGPSTTTVPPRQQPPAKQGVDERRQRESSQEGGQEGHEKEGDGKAVAGQEEGNQEEGAGAQVDCSQEHGT
jgi:hypothetical protein